MLLLSRKKGEKVMIGPNIEVTVLDVQGDKVRLGFNAPLEVSINREEVFNRLQADNRASRLEQELSRENRKMLLH